MENKQKYSLALVDEVGTTVLVTLSCSPKYKSLNLKPNNCMKYTLKELCYFTFCFRNPLQLRHHLAHAEGCIDGYFKDKSSLIHFVIQESKLVILDEFGNIAFDTLLFCDEDFRNEFYLNNPLLFFENLICSKFEVQDIDWLLGFSRCMREVLERQKKYNSNPLLCRRLELVDVFSNGIDFFKKDENNELPCATLDNEALHLLLKGIFSVIDLKDDNIEHSVDSIDWELILFALKYYKMKLPAKDIDSAQKIADDWQKKYNRPRRSRGNKGWA